VGNFQLPQVGKFGFPLTPRQRQRASTLETRRAALMSWIAEDIPTTRMLELARQDPRAPYTGGASTFYRFVATLRAEREAGAAPVIRFEGLPGEYVQWDWGEARVRPGGGMIKRVFLAGRLKYSRVSAIRWRTQMDLETLLRAMLEIVEGWGGMPWAWVFEDGDARPRRHGAAAVESRLLAFRHRGRVSSGALRSRGGTAEGQRRESRQMGEDELPPRAELRRR
jgi:hypothetical protein